MRRRVKGRRREAGRGGGHVRRRRRGTAAAPAAAPAPSGGAVRPPRAQPPALSAFTPLPAVAARANPNRYQPGGHPRRGRCGWGGRAARRPRPLRGAFPFARWRRPGLRPPLRAGPQAEAWPGQRLAPPGPAAARRGPLHPPQPPPPPPATPGEQEWEGGLGLGPAAHGSKETRHHGETTKFRKKWPSRRLAVKGEMENPSSPPFPPSSFAR